MVHFLLAITAPILEQEWKKLQAQTIGLSKSDSKYKKLFIEIEQLQSVVQCIRALFQLVILVALHSHTKGVDPSKDMGTWGSLDFLDSAIYNFQKYKLAFRAEKMTKSRKRIYNRVLEEKQLALSKKYNLGGSQQWPSNVSKTKAECEALDEVAAFSTPKIHMI
jgi:hypothetical protein